MRFMMMMMIPKVYQSAGDDPPPMPNAEQIAAMMAYNEALEAAGLLISLDGLHPPAGAARIRFAGGKPTDVSPAEAGPGNVLGGYWMIRAPSLAEAADWARRCPAADGDVIEVRQVHEMSDFPAESIEGVKDSAAALDQRLKDAGGGR